jgi:hypothetical protein
MDGLKDHLAYQHSRAIWNSGGKKVDIMPQLWHEIQSRGYAGGRSMDFAAQVR